VGGVNAPVQRFGSGSVFALLVTALLVPATAFVFHLSDPRPSSAPIVDPEAASGFTFAAAGDHSDGSDFQASLDALATAGTDFYLALGDFSYGGVEQDWCDRVTTAMGTSYPFELISGNHEDDFGDGGWVGNFTACLPDHVNAQGSYGAQYYFDYPPSAPLARVIGITPDLTVFGTYRTFTAGDAESIWLANAIDGARSAGIPWVIVGMHKVCITTGDKSCEIGQDLLDLLLSKRVDLILQGHDHNYQRSRQLTCATAYAFVPACVADDGSDNVYAKGAGSVIVVQGIFGACCYAVNPADEEAGYFTPAIDDTTTGFVKYTVTASRIDVQLVNVIGSFTDSFHIASGVPSGPGVLGATLSPSLADVTLSWTLPSVEVNVDHYEVLRSTTYDASGTGYMKVSLDAAMPPGTTSWIDVGAGSAAQPYFYTVRAVNAVGDAAQAPGQVSRFSVPLSAGANPVAVPLITPSFAIQDHFRTTASWTVARAYDPSDAADPWKRYEPARPGNDLLTVDRTVGVWITATAAGSYRVAGLVPCATNVFLRAGWNLVGSPAVTPRTVAQLTAGLQGPLTAEGPDPAAAAYRLQTLAPSSIIVPGAAYWIESPTAQTWSWVNDPSPTCAGVGGYRPATTHGTFRLAVPAYFYPTDTDTTGVIWDRMLAKGPSLALAVVNPADGPGTTVDSEYVSAIANTQAQGVEPFGYVFTLYGTRPLGEVTAEVDAWVSLYGLSDIFFDEVPSDPGYEAYYASLAAYVRGNGGRVILNPGTAFSETYMASADLAVLFEDTAATYSTFTMPAWVYTYPADRFWHIVHTASLSELDIVLAEAEGRNAGYIYVTDDVESNPYDSLPSYWESL